MINDIIISLKKNGIKVTPQRLAIIKYLENDKDHSSAEQIYNHLIKDFPTISLATVYNTLEMLEEIKMINKIKISDENVVNYEYNKKMHHHFYCKKCKKIYDIEISCKIAELKEFKGYQIDEVYGYFKGICKKCQSDN
ncbi:MAG: transcriptional repressor [Spirochaetes bacterium]|nr:transcriptional repressor [Spirochaetota bacterium]